MKDKIFKVIARLGVGLMILGGVIIGLLLLSMILLMVPIPFLETGYITSALAGAEGFDAMFEVFFRAALAMVIISIGGLAYTLGHAFIEGVNKRKKTDF